MVHYVALLPGVEPRGLSWGVESSQVDLLRSLTCFVVRENQAFSRTTEDAARGWAWLPGYENVRDVVLVGLINHPRHQCQGRLGRLTVEGLDEVRITSAKGQQGFK